MRFSSQLLNIKNKKQIDCTSIRNKILKCWSKSKSKGRKCRKIRTKKVEKKSYKNIKG